MASAPISRERALTILNHVAEEWTDDGVTSFATKAELCATIRWLQMEQLADLQRKDAGLIEIMRLAMETRLYRHAP